MVITVTCPSCTSSFPVDPAKIPEGGVNARCTQCNSVFRVEKPAPEPLPELPEITLEEPAVEAAPAFHEPPLAVEEQPAAVEVPPLPDFPATEALPEMGEVVRDPAPALDPTPAFSEPVAGHDPFAEAAPFEAGAGSATEAPPPLEEVPTPVEAAAESAASAGAVQGFTFGKRDPTDKAKRLARVLVSDMIMYNAERHESALETGTLVQDFEEEIQKSWKEYVDQVGEEMANGEGRQFWTAALNDILAKGKDIF